MADVKLDSGGIGALLKSGAMHDLVQSVAEEVAENARAQGVMVDGVPGTTPLPVEVSMTTTDRARANVVLAHPAGIAVQAKHGALTKAAGAAGLGVSG